MKNIFYGALTLLSSAMIVSSCSKTDLGTDQQPDEQKKEGITRIAATIGEQNNTKTSYDEAIDGLKVTWNATEVFYGKSFYPSGGYSRKQLYKSNATQGNSQATFEVKYHNGADWYTTYISEKEELHTIYPGRSEIETAFTSDNTDLIVLPLTGQTGKIGGLSDFDYLTGIATAANTVDDLDALQLTLKRRVTIIRLKDLTFPGLTGGTATNISVSATGLYDKAQIVFTKGKTNDNPDPITAAAGATNTITTSGSFTVDASGKISAENVYIVFFSHDGLNGADFTFEAEVGGKTYAANKTAPSSGFKVGEMYTITGLTMVEVAKPGHYYYDDNTFSKVYDSGKTAIGVVYWVDPTNATKGQIISLDEPSARWNGGINAAGTLKWSTEKVAIEGTFSNTDSKVNTGFVKKYATTNFKTNYPAVAWCDEKGNDWYLPALDELSAIREWWNGGSVPSNVNGSRAKNNGIITTAGGAGLIANYYWSSTQSNSDNAWFVNFGNGTTANNGGKDSYGYVRCVRAF